MLVNLIYRIYPALPWMAEYRLAIEISKKYVCRSVLDVGCGYGNLFKILDSHGLVDRYVGIDKHVVPRINNGKARFIKHDARHPLNLNEHFDCVFFVNSLFYIGIDAVSHFAGLGDITTVIDIDPSRPHIFMTSKLERVKRLPLNQLVNILESRGFKILSKKPGTTYAVVLTT